MLGEVVTAKLEHVPLVAENMRALDAFEIWMAADKAPLQALLDGFSASVKVWTILGDGVPIGMFGVTSVSILGNTGIPWLLGTDDMLKIRRQFLIQSQRYVDEMLALYPYLVNFVHHLNKPSLRWLKGLGFTIHAAVETGPYRAKFHKFERFADV